MLLNLLKSLVRSSNPHAYNAREDVTVVVQTVLRPSLARALESIITQDFKGRIRILVGIDVRRGSAQPIHQLRRKLPNHIELTLIDLGYSTSERHGGIHSNHFGGSLRTILSFAANTRYVCYLDDDDWFAPNHISKLHSALAGKGWGFSHRWFVNAHNLEPMCIDTLENLGPGKGIYAAQGGFACPSSLMIDKLMCAPALHAWSIASTAQGDGEDRMFFSALQQLNLPFACSEVASAYCVIKPEDGLTQIRLDAITQSGYSTGLFLGRSTPADLARF
jgi:hypothetical protein